MNQKRREKKTQKPTDKLRIWTERIREFGEEENSNAMSLPIYKQTIHTHTQAYT